MSEPTGVKEELRKLDPYEFEQFVAAVWENQGYATEVKSQSRDAGIDVIATENDPYPRKVVIQVKRYDEGNNVTSEEVQRYQALRRQEDADEVLIVTTSGFTNAAQARSEDLNVKLVNGDQLLQIIEQNNAWDIVDSYLGTNISESDSTPDSPDTRRPDVEEVDEELDMPTAIIYVIQGGIALLVLAVILYYILDIFIVNGVL